MTDRERVELQLEADRWEIEVERLEKVADRQGYRAVAPILNWRD